MNFTRLSVSELVTLGSACGWLSNDTDGLAGWLVVDVVEVGVHGLCTEADAARRAWSIGCCCTKITAVSTAGFDWGHSSYGLQAET